MLSVPPEWWMQFSGQGRIHVLIQGWGLRSVDLCSLAAWLQRLATWIHRLKTWLRRITTSHRWITTTCSLAPETYDTDPQTYNLRLGSRDLRLGSVDLRRFGSGDLRICRLMTEDPDTSDSTQSVKYSTSWKMDDLVVNCYAELSHTHGWMKPQSPDSYFW